MNHILKHCLVGVLLLASFCVSAQEKTRLATFYQALESNCLGFTCEYMFTPAKTTDISGPGKVTGKAEIELQGDAYIFSGNGLIIRSDGKSVCVVDDSAKEIVYEEMPESMSEMDFLQNPAYLIRDLKDNFKVSGSSKEKDADVYVLVPTINCGVGKCTLKFTGNCKGPSPVSLEMADGSRLDVDMSGYDFLPLKPLSYFAPPAPESFDSSWIVTDLR